ncbi:hypothetical protein C8Q79DRAFT_747927 [Trametes meyenii]|nr:hypothetical protein C8Q79DRAFT_747927 [Trametes meyenii]
MHLSLSTVSTLMRAWMFSPYASPFIRAEQSTITSSPYGQNIPVNLQELVPSRCQLGIAPSCEDELRVAGFMMSCLRLITFGDTETYTTTLYTDTTGNSGHHGVKAQSIQIEVSFPSSGSWSIAAKFSILHSFPISTAHTPPSSNISTAYTSPSPVISSSAQSVVTGDMRNRNHQRVSFLQNKAGTTCQTSWELVEADPAEWFSSPFSGRYDKGIFARLLRLTMRVMPDHLARPLGTRSGSRITKLELRIELSDRYWHEKPERIRITPEPLPAPSYYNHIPLDDSTSAIGQLLHERGNQWGLAGGTVLVADKGIKPPTKHDFLDSNATDSTGTSDHSNPSNTINLFRKSTPKTQRVDRCETRHTRSKPVLESSSTLPAAALTLSDNDRARTSTRSRSNNLDKRHAVTQDGVDTRTSKRRRARKCKNHHPFDQVDGAFCPSTSPLAEFEGLALGESGGVPGLTDTKTDPSQAPGVHP